MRRDRSTSLAAAAMLGVIVAAASAPGALKSGLIGEYFKLGGGPAANDQPPPGMKPFYVRVDKQVNFSDVGGEFYRTKLSDNFLVRWTGTLRVAKAGRYAFVTNSDDGSRLYIDGKRVVDNWGAHSMQTRSGSVSLTAGDHKIRITFSEGGGGAGCIVTWTPPGGRRRVLSSRVLFHDPQALGRIAWDAKRWKKTRGGGGGGAGLAARWGPCLGTAVRVGRDEEGDNIVYRAYVIRLDPEGNACVVFDGDTMRMAAGWTEPALKLQGLPFSGTGQHEKFPAVSGETVFTNRASPGWGRNGSIADPRKSAYSPLGHLPKDWTHFKGLYLHGGKTLVTYTVGLAEVLELPALETFGEQKAIVRNLQIKGDGKAMTLVVADAGGDAVQLRGRTMATFGEDPVTAAGVSGAPSGTKFASLDGRLVLRLPSSRATVKFKLLLWRGEAQSLPEFQRHVAASRPSADLTALTKGGPPRWPEVSVTQGKLGGSGAPYVIDRITVPHNSPYAVPGREGGLRIGGMDFFSNGTSAAVSTWDGDVWIVKGIDANLSRVRWKRFASGIHEPLGLKIVDDVIYTVSDDMITRYHDYNSDGEADFLENFNNDWELTDGFHAFCFDLHTDAQGNFYFAFGSPVHGGGRSFERMGRHHGSIIKVSKDGSTLERYASGLRAPNGMCVGPDGQVTSSDNEGTFVPHTPINWINKGSFLGVIDSAENRMQYKTTATRSDRTGGRRKHLDPSEMPKPLAWLPKGVDNSGGGQAWVTSKRWGPFEGELLHMSYGRCSLFLVLKENKNGQMQGGVVKFPLRFSSSCMRARFNKRDGQLYVVGLKGWQTNAGSQGGFDRVRYTGKKVYMPGSLRVRKNGIEIGFTQRLDNRSASDAGLYSVKAADIRWTHGYGSGEYRIGQRASSRPRGGWTTLNVTSAKLMPDGKTVLLEVADMQPAHLMEIAFNIKAADGTPIRSKIHNTVHVLE